ncbi:MAG: GNAT family N-acetyltransferase [Candidatus Sabulitectum sp.]|nr:GNAT family N-acetyltransferase [Candidatus Sabulitectum sp.]
MRFDGEAIGTVAIVEGDGHIEVGRFIILPDYQNRGIGSIILHRILREADRDNMVLRLSFLTGNRAETLYRRNGFELVKQTETHSYMVRRARGVSYRTLDACG